MKVEYPSLYPPGFHDVDVLRLEESCIAAFSGPSREHRQHLLDRFKAFLSALRATGLRGSVWVDGSFTTEKEDPEDVDILIVFDSASVSTANFAELQQLFDRTVAKLRYKCDVYAVGKDDQVGVSYWRGWYGFDRNDIPKGIVRIGI